ncbi:MAG: hypothetical protein ACI854_002265 [Arenicella sp.]
MHVYVNRTLIEDVRFGGPTRVNKRAELPQGLITQKNNIVTVTVVGDTGLFADLILVDDVSLSESELLSRAAFYDFLSNVDNFYSVSLHDSASALVYAYTSVGQSTLTG